MSEFNVNEETQRKLEVFQFKKCRVFDYDTKDFPDVPRAHLLILKKLRDLLANLPIPCVVERTTNGYHVIALHEDDYFDGALKAVPGFDSLHWRMSPGTLRTRKKKTENFSQSFIQERFYFNMSWLVPEAMKEFCEYSDAVLLNTHKDWHYEDWEDEEQDIPF